MTFGAVSALLTATTRRARAWRELSALELGSILVGVTIGAGVYEAAARVFASVSSEAEALGVWGAGGVLLLLGAHRVRRGLQRRAGT